MTSARVLLALGFSGAWLACSSYGNDSPSAPAPPDAGNDAAVVGDMPEAGAEAGPGGPGCPEKIVYVAPAPAGNDTNVGCERAAPKATIGGALAYLKTLELVDHEIHVCRGTYAESVVFDYPASIRGGYECSTFVRLAGFGFGGIDPTTGRVLGFDTTNETILEPGASDASVTLTIKGAAITRAQRVEGVSVHGRTSGDGYAIFLSDGASPVLTDDFIRGPLTLPTTVLTGSFGSVGIGITGDAAPELVHSRIKGGSGNTAGNSSVGSTAIIVRTSGAVSIHDNEIDSGSGVGTGTNTMGVNVAAPTQMVGPTALVHNSIFFHSPNGGAAPTASQGIGVSEGTTVEIVDNVIIGDAFACSPGCGAYAIFAGGSGARIRRNRIVGATGNDASAIAYGVVVGGTASDTDVENNLIDVVPSAVATTIGVFNDPNASNVHITSNTLYGHGATGTLGLSSYGAQTTVDNNLFIGLSFGVATGTCSTTNATEKLPVELKNNAFVGVSPVLVRIGPAGDCAAPATDTAALLDMEAKLGAGIAQNNVALLATCGDASPRCRPCPGSGCAGEVITSKSLSDLLKDGWPLPTTAWCGISQGGLDLTARGITVDATNAARTAPSSIGAREQDGACAP